MFQKNSAKMGDLIYLSKPLGTGYLLAAYFNNSEMLSSNDFEKILNNLKREIFLLLIVREIWVLKV